MFTGSYLLAFSATATATATTARTPNCHKKPLDNGQFSQRPKKKTKNPGMVTKFDPYNPLMILNRGNRILIVFHLFCCSKHKLFTILTANVASLVRIIMHVNLLDSKNYLRFFWSILPLNCIPLWHTVTINLAQ